MKQSSAFKPTPGSRTHGPAPSNVADSQSGAGRTHCSVLTVQDPAKAGVTYRSSHSAAARLP
jgi:hypothetical protein